MTPSARAENPFALWLQAAVVGAAVLGLAWLLQPPLMVPFPGHGEYFAQQSVDPWSLQGKFPQRILWPALAHLCGLGGARSPIFSQLSSGVLLAVVFWFCRRRGAAAVDALLVTAAVGLTGAVQLYQVMSCHSDTWNWILMLLLVHHVARRFVFWPLVLLAALSHEMIFFFAPWLVYLRWRETRRLLPEVAALALCAGLYQVWRMVVKSYGAAPSFDVHYYLENHWLPWGTLGLWLLLVLLLLIEFGPMLVVVVWGWRENGFGWGRWGPWLYGGCVLSLMGFAYDVPRFACYAFLPLVLASIPMLARPRGRAVYAMLLGFSGVSYFALHLRMGQDGGWVFDLTRRLIQENGVLEAHWKFFTEALPRAWPWALLVSGLAGAVVVAGRRLGRYLAVSAAIVPRTTQNASP
ncbi:MAG: hypothetical protein JNM25_12010 [Planctomycetes bacterium]|nr:hypothetical protein [Planctomycetota bacterium]